MKTRVRLRLILPVVAVAIAGLLFVQFGLDAVGLGSDEPATAAASPVSAEPQSAEQATAAASPVSAEPTAETPVDGEEIAAPDDSGSDVAADSGGMMELRSALQTYGVVVLVVYSPKGNVDSTILSEARLGADEMGAGFVAVNAKKETMVGELALTYDIRETPTVLVFTQGTEPEVGKRFIGYADRETVAQAIHEVDA